MSIFPSIFLGIMTYALLKREEEYRKKYCGTTANIIFRLHADKLFDLTHNIYRLSSKNLASDKHYSQVSLQLSYFHLIKLGPKDGKFVTSKVKL